MVVVIGWRTCSFSEGIHFVGRNKGSDDRWVCILYVHIDPQFLFWMVNIVRAGNSLLACSENASNTRRSLSSGSHAEISVDKLNFVYSRVSVGQLIEMARASKPLIVCCVLFFGTWCLYSRFSQRTAVGSSRYSTVYMHRAIMKASPAISPMWLC